MTRVSEGYLPCAASENMREFRHALELRATGKTLTGYAAVYNARSHDLGGWYEIIAPGAFDDALNENRDVPALYDHDRKQMLARSGAGTLRLSSDERGLKFEIDTPNTTIGRDVLEMVRRGDVTGASFAFTPKLESWDESQSLRTLNAVDLHDITVTPFPAYPDVSVAMRGLSTRIKNSPDSLRLAQTHSDSRKRAILIEPTVSAHLRARHIRLMEIGT